jgi:hypothetical protein
MPAMRTTGSIAICIAALLSLLGVGPTPGRAQSDADAALAAITRHPTVEARLKTSKARLVWMALPVEDNLACYMLKENHPTHMATVGQYCLDRNTGKVLEYDVVTDRYLDLQ